MKVQEATGGVPGPTFGFSFLKGKLYPYPENIYTKEHTKETLESKIKYNILKD